MPKRRTLSARPSFRARATLGGGRTTRWRAAATPPTEAAGRRQARHGGGGGGGNGVAAPTAGPPPARPPWWRQRRPWGRRPRRPYPLPRGGGLCWALPPATRSWRPLLTRSPTGGAPSAALRRRRRRVRRAMFASVTRRPTAERCGRCLEPLPHAPKYLLVSTMVTARLLSASFSGGNFALTARPAWQYLTYEKHTTRRLQVGDSVTSLSAAVSPATVGSQTTASRRT